MTDYAHLLGRPERLSAPEAFARIVTGRRVMVIGAGGSIGSELASRIAASFPEHLSLVNHTEIHLYEASARIAAERPGLAFSSILCDIRDKRRVAAVVQQERPSLVFHAAALKHIPLVEASPLEGILTNTMGTQHVVDVVRDQGARLVFLSTDKAVYPSSVMGATKRLAELYCLAAGGPETRVARLVNVLGSSGSVVPLFERQLADGRALTVTHRDMERYFITVREAADYLLQVAAARVSMGERVVFVPRVPSIRIMDLADRMRDAAGRTEPVVVTGMRPGEKLTEALTYSDEIEDRAGEWLTAARAPARPVDLAPLIDAAREHRTEAAMWLLRKMLPEYHAPGVAA